MKHTFSLLLLAAVLLASCKSGGNAAGGGESDSTAVCPVSFCADSAFMHIEKQCAFGARTPGSAAHDACMAWIADAFKERGCQVHVQRASVRAWDGKTLDIANVIASYRPEAADRILLCAHWDSRPWADADPDTANHHLPVPAANDGASGVGVMLELARLLPELAAAQGDSVLPFGVDFVCFDAEDYGAPYWDESRAPSDGSDWCIGSRHFAKNPPTPGYTARFGILFDMVGGEDARFCYEGHSLRYAQAFTMRLWAAARTAGFATLFVSQDGGWATDDHVPLNEILGVPTVDVIPFTESSSTFGATWHTVSDTPEHISRTTLRGVGQSVLQLLHEMASE